MKVIYNTPLHEAVSDKCINLLLRAGADENALDFGGHTPLDTDVYRQMDECRCGVALLLCAGADVKAKSNANLTPLHCARTPVVVRQLLEYGANVNVADQNNRTPLMATLASPLTSNPLQVVRLLINAGAHVDYCDMLGYTAFAYAIRYWDARKDSRECERILTALLVAGASLQCRAVGQILNMTALVMAATPECVRFLLIAGLKPTKADVQHLVKESRQNCLLAITVMYPETIAYIQNI